MTRTGACVAARIETDPMSPLVPKAGMLLAETRHAPLSIIWIIINDNLYYITNNLYYITNDNLHYITKDNLYCRRLFWPADHAFGGDPARAITSNIDYYQ